MIAGSVWGGLTVSGNQFFIFGAIVVTVLGLCIGSFINVIIYRLPRGESIVTGRSHCTHCGNMIAWYDLFPLASYLLLGGRCRRCKASISWRYPLVESLTAALFLILYFRFGLAPVLLKYLFLSALLVAVSFIDLERFLIPNSLVLAGVVFGVAAVLLIRDTSLLSALLGAVSSSGFLLLVCLVSRGGMGLGDVKLALVTGLFLGWPRGLEGVLIGACAGGLLGIVLLMTGIKGRKDPIPFGPFIALGAMIALVWGGQILHLLLWPMA
jgi:leader peptidase (prepilin peptidase)/N-methyltransferase